LPGVDLQPGNFSRSSSAIRPRNIQELLQLYLKESDNPGRLREVIAIPALSDAWRNYLRGRLANL
jgi:MOSC domain-containing protein YiiM